MTAKVQPIIVIKKKGGHGGHHGGAWKVAYADFVTAMMALFIVLWLTSQSDPVKKAVAGYFNDPKGLSTLLGTTLTGTGTGATPVPEQNLKQLEALKEKLEQEIQAIKELEKLKKQIEITITPEGLRIELLEGKDGTFYQSGSAKLSPNGQELLALLAKELKTLPNQLQIEGHTDAAPYSNDADYGNWELSADRANSARRLLQQDGVRTDQVTQVRGYADQLLRVKSNPYDPSNRRISILVKNSDAASPKLLEHARVVGGAPGAVPSAAAPGAPAPPSAPAGPANPATAQAKPATALAKPSPATPAKPGMFSKLTGLFSGGKK
jgi:chemotaxis protein MotB